MKKAENVSKIIAGIVLIMALNSVVQAGEDWAIQDFQVVKDFPDSITAGSTYELRYTFKSTHEVPLQIILNVSEFNVVNIGEWFVGVTLNGDHIAASEVSGGHFSTDEFNISKGSHELKISLSSRPDILPSTYDFAIQMLSSKIVIYSQSSSLGGGGSSGGTGGEGVVTCEDLGNIDRYQTLQKNIVEGAPVAYRFSEPLVIYEISTTGKENRDYVSVRVELLKKLSVCVGKPAPDTVYRYTNAWIGSSVTKDITVRFKVENSWIDEKNISTKNISIFKWDKSIREWIKLDTVEINRDDTYTYFESKTGSLSPFAISGLTEEFKEIVIPTTTSTTVLEVPMKEKSFPFWLIFWIIILILLAGTGYYVWKKRRNKKNQEKK